MCVPPRTYVLIWRCGKHGDVDGVEARHTEVMSGMAVAKGSTLGGHYVRADGCNELLYAPDSGHHQLKW